MELRRLFSWLKERGVTAVITGERGNGALTRNGLEEYVSDCVILLDHRVTDQVSTRRLRIIKYRGSIHGTNEYPFLIDENGIFVIPITSRALQHKVSNKRVFTGVPDLDAMLDGKGLYRGAGGILIFGEAEDVAYPSIWPAITLAKMNQGNRVLSQHDNSEHDWKH
jgi:circadian clock protein KaiC